MTDDSGNLTGIQRPDGSLLTFAYDAAGQITVRKTPDTTTTFSYDCPPSRNTCHFSGLIV